METLITSNKMKNYFIKILWTTLLISLLSSVFLVTVILQIEKTDNVALHFNATGIMYGVCIFFNIIMGILSISIFLNLNIKIRNNLTLSMLTFIIIPLIAFLSFIGLTYHNFDKGFWASIAVTTPYLIIMIVQFINYRNVLNKNL